MESKRGVRFGALTFADLGVVVPQAPSMMSCHSLLRRLPGRVVAWSVLVGSMIGSGLAAVPVPMRAGVSSPVGAGWAAKTWGDPLTDANAKDTKGKNAPDLDAGSLATVTTVIGARQVWAQNDA